MSTKLCIGWAGAMGAIGILVGAFGAHALPAMLSQLDDQIVSQRLDWLDTGSRYHLLHAVALLSFAACKGSNGAWNRTEQVAAICWLLGICLFSGSLYVMAGTGLRGLGAVVPLGGVAFVIGWVAVGVSCKTRAHEYGES